MVHILLHRRIGMGMSRDDRKLCGDSEAEEQDARSCRRGI